MARYQGFFSLDSFALLRAGVSSTPSERLCDIFAVLRKLRSKRCHRKLFPEKESHRKYGLRLLLYSSRNGMERPHAARPRSQAANFTDNNSMGRSGTPPAPYPTFNLRADCATTPCLQVLLEWMGRSSVGMQRNQDSSMLHAVQSRCRIVAAEHMPDGHGRQSTKGMPLAVLMLVLLERAKWFEGSTPGTDNSKAQVTAHVSHICVALLTQTPTLTQNASALNITETCERPPPSALSFFLSLPSAPTDDDDGEAALHFLALPWAGPVEGSARGA